MSEGKVSLSAKQRYMLRKAITAHAGWKLLRETNGLKVETMTPSALVEVAKSLGIDTEVFFVEAQAEANAEAQLPETFTETVKESTDMTTTAFFPTANTSKADLLAKLIGELTTPLDEATVGKLIDARIKKAFEGIPSIQIEVKRQDGSTKKVEGHTHPKFKTLLRSLAARRANGMPLNVWIAGPAGSGKTHAVRQAAEALGADFYYHGAVTGAFELLGWKDAGGTYHRTQFREAFENGGIVLLDEVDGYEANATLSVNAALENGICVFPDGQIARHKDCIIVGAGNTWGSGATSDYVGRNKLDGAFIDRFHVAIDWDYDTGLEIAISGNEGWARRVIAARARARTHQLKILITPRASQAGAALIAQGFSDDEAASMTYLRGLSKDQIRMVEGA